MHAILYRQYEPEPCLNCCVCIYMRGTDRVSADTEISDDREEQDGAFLTSQELLRVRGLLRHDKTSPKLFLTTYACPISSTCCD